MSRRMPVTLIAAEVSIALLVVNVVTTLGLDIRKAQLHAGAFLHLAWSVPAVVGIPFGHRGIWRFASVASGLLAVLGALSLVFLVFTTVVASFTAVVAPNDFYGGILLGALGVLHLWVIYRLLNWPSSVSYFESENGTGPIK
jgi:hypothetical protein